MKNTSNWTKMSNTTLLLLLKTKSLIIWRRLVALKWGNVEYVLGHMVSDLVLADRLGYPERYWFVMKKIDLQDQSIPIKSNWSFKTKWLVIWQHTCIGIWQLQDIYSYGIIHVSFSSACWFDDQLHASSLRVLFKLSEIRHLVIKAGKNNLTVSWKLMIFSIAPVFPSDKDQWAVFSQYLG